MPGNKRLLRGAFYWVIPEVNPDAEDRDQWQPGQEWQDEMQPARFNGWDTAGEMLWSFMGFDGSSNCRCCGSGKRSRYRSCRSVIQQIELVI